MDTEQRIEIGDFLLIAEASTGVAAEQLARITRTMRLAQSALAAPYSGFGDVLLFPTFEERAGVYATRVATYHPLPDGNKRAAYDVMREFVARNGRTFTHPSGGLMATAEAMEQVAAGEMTEREFLEWLRPLLL
jgi:death-on-curing protein